MLRRMDHDNPVVERLERLIVHIQATEPTYASLMRPDRYTHPLPFFGDITNAKVITVGVNPSADEFADGRQWPCLPLNAPALAHRLTRYFDTPETPHPWFEGWGRALRAIDAAYPQQAAHIDLSLARRSRSEGSHGARTRIR